MLAYMLGIHNYRCCPHNYGMGWPYYAQELWFATWDKGLCAAMYGDSQVTAKVGAGATTVTVTEDTDYPFSDTITLTMGTPGAVAFPLYLRIPEWCTGRRRRVNGTVVTGHRRGRLVRHRRPDLEQRRQGHRHAADAHHRADLGEERQRDQRRQRAADVLAVDRGALAAHRRHRRVADQRGVRQLAVELRPAPRPGQPAGDGHPQTGGPGGEPVHP